MSSKYILALDQGTSGTTVVVVDKAGAVVSRAYREFTQIYPKPGWVEHDPQEIWAATLSTTTQALTQANLTNRDIHSIGITNQRETTVVWNKKTGVPVSNAIVWQCRRTAQLCQEMKDAGLSNMISQRTGLIIDAYFSATKLAWILENVSEARKMAEAGELMFGTIDTWLLWKLSGGKVHATDYSNASRTMLFNIHSLKWDTDIIDYFNIPSSLLPEVKNSSGIYGYTDPKLLGVEIPIAGLAGDQQAALFGQTCFTEGTAKSTYGTGSFLLLNTGTKPITSQHGLLTTIAWGLENEIYYALEGSIFIAGAAVQWLRDELKVLDNVDDSEKLASSLTSNDGVYLVPAFVGIGAPYWDMNARGVLVGITRGTGRAHLARAVLESIAYQTYDVIKAMTDDSGLTLQKLNVDGGASTNNFLMQFQADILGVDVERPMVADLTAVGAAYLAGLGSKFWSSKDDLYSMKKIDRHYKPKLPEEERIRLINSWKKAVSCCLQHTV